MTTARASYILVLHQRSRSRRTSGWDTALLPSAVLLALCVHRLAWSVPGWIFFPRQFIVLVSIGKPGRFRREGKCYRTYNWREHSEARRLLGTCQREWTVWGIALICVYPML